MTDPTSSVLYVIACGGPASGQLGPFVDRMRARGWDVCVIATPMAVRFMDTAALRAKTGHVVRIDYKQPNEPDVLPPPDVMAVVPATFNTINKMAAGISDTLALGLLNEAIGHGIPIVALPTPSTGLARHPAFVASVATLRSWGVTVLFDPRRYPLAEPRQDVPPPLPWEELERLVVERRHSPWGVHRPVIDPGDLVSSPDRADGGDPGTGTGTGTDDVKTRFLAYLDTYRETVARKVAGLSGEQLRRPVLPSGWSPLELVKHLVFMERRWLVWGFTAEPVPDPFGDQRDGRWHVDADESVDDLIRRLRAGGDRTRRIVEVAELSTPGALGGRFPHGTRPPTLAAILFHVTQEYARHTGHLDAVRELLDGTVGE